MDRSNWCDGCFSIPRSPSRDVKSFTNSHAIVLFLQVFLKNFSQMKPSFRKFTIDEDAPVCTLYSYRDENLAWSLPVFHALAAQLRQVFDTAEGGSEPLMTPSKLKGRGKDDLIQAVCMPTNVEGQTLTGVTVCCDYNQEGDMVRALCIPTNPSTGLLLCCPDFPLSLSFSWLRSKSELHTANHLVPLPTLRARQAALFTEGEGCLWVNGVKPSTLVTVVDPWYDMPESTKQASFEAMTAVQLKKLAGLWPKMTSASAHVAFIWCGRGQVRPHACTPLV